MWKIICFPSKRVVLQYVPKQRKGGVLTTRRLFSDKSSNFFAQCTSMFRKLIFLRRLTLFQTILWTRRNQFWQFWRSFLAEDQKFFTQVPKVEKKLTNFFREVIVFENFSTKNWIFFAQCTKNFRKMNNFQKKLFCLKCSYGEVDSSLDRTIEILFAESQKLFTQFPKIWKKIPVFLSCFDKKPKNFRSMSEHYKKNTNFKMK